MTHYVIRSALAADAPLLWQMLDYAAHMDESGEPPASARPIRRAASINAWASPSSPKSLTASAPPHS